MRCGGILAVAAILLCGVANAANNVNVSVGGSMTSGGGGYYGGGTTTPVLMFDPPDVTINVGDTVTFTNLGGVSTGHNVHADDDSFRCANGCRGVGGATGDPSPADWSSSVTFTKAGVITYHCDEHQSLGMTGSITVNAVASAFTIKPGLSGNWSDPTASQAGHGFQFEILPNNSMLAIWFVFTPNGSGQTWLFAQGNYDPASDTVTLPTYLSLGARFPPNFTHADDTVTQWGTMTFKFTDCNNGTMNWNSTTAGYPPTGTLPIARVTTLAGTTCP
jgi:plastocyanin